jgi:hypothetical protein
MHNKVPKQRNTFSYHWSECDVKNTSLATQGHHIMKDWAYLNINYHGVSAQT